MTDLIDDHLAELRERLGGDPASREETVNAIRTRLRADAEALARRAARDRARRDGGRVMRVALATALLALGAALAGCVEDAAQDARAPAGNAQEDAGGGEEPAARAGAPPTAAPERRGPAILYLTSELGVSALPPAEDARVPLGPTVNSPLAEEYPEWSGRAPAEAAGATGEATLVLYATCETVCVAANTAAVAPAGPFDFADFMLDARLGNLTVAVGVEGPDAIAAGQVVEVRVPLGALARPLEAGARVSALVVATYTHAEEGAELLFAIGPDHPMRIEIGNA